MSEEDKLQILANHKGTVLKQALYYYRSSKFNDGAKFSRRLALDDFIQEGNLGLMKAIKGYDVKNKSKATFHTYCH